MHPSGNKEKHMNVQGYKNRWYGLIFICISLLVISLDNTVLNVALPAISRDLGATASDLQWIVDAYILVFAAMLLTMGAVGDRIGRKRALQFGVLWFGVFSLMAALSTSTNMLIASRALLGIGGATIMPATLSLVTASFRDAKERAQAIAIWAAVFGLGLGIGPLIGGFLLEHFTWSSVFFVNLPVVATSMIGGYFFLEDSRDEHAPSPDIPGVLLSITGLFALVYGIIEAGVSGWGATNVVVAFVAAAVLLALFGWWENRAPNAMLPLYLFRNMSFTGANLAMTLMMFGMFGATFFLSQFFQSVQGYTALETGIRLFPMSLMIMFAAANSARVSARLGTKLTVGIGFMIAAVGMGMLSQLSSVGASYLSMLTGLTVMAAGMGMAMSPATDSIMSSVPVNKAGIGSAMNDTTRQIGGALGVAVLGTIMNNAYLKDIASLKDQIPADAYAAVSSSVQGANAIAARAGAPLGSMIESVADKAFVSGMTEAMLIAAFIMAFASAFTFAVLPARAHCIEPECDDEEAETAERDSRSPVPAAGD
jgi:EmrB/QacA subfamily drug resistance transporter